MNFDNPLYKSIAKYIHRHEKLTSKRLETAEHLKEMNKTMSGYGFGQESIKLDQLDYAIIENLFDIGILRTELVSSWE